MGTDYSATRQSQYAAAWWSGVTTTGQPQCGEGGITTTGQTQCGEDGTETDYCATGQTQCTAAAGSGVTTTGQTQCGEDGTETVSLSVGDCPKTVLRLSEDCLEIVRRLSATSSVSWPIYIAAVRTRFHEFSELIALNYCVFGGAYVRPPSITDCRTVCVGGH